MIMLVFGVNVKHRSEYLNVPVPPSVNAADVAFTNHCSPPMAVLALFEIGLGVAFPDEYLSKAHSH